MGPWHNLGGKIKRALKPVMPNKKPCRVSPFSGVKCRQPARKFLPLIGALARNETAALGVSAVVLVGDKGADIQSKCIDGEQGGEPNKNESENPE